MRIFLQTAILACGVAAGLYAQADRVPSGTEVVVRTNQAIDAKSPSDSRIYNAVVDRDVTDRSGRVVIPRGSNAELILRDSSNNQVVLDLESVDVNGQRYTVSSPPESVTTDSSGEREGVGANKRTGKYVGGGAVIGSIIGAIAGGGKGAAIGAATGAGAGALGQTVTRGGKVRVPAETLLTFRLDRGLTVGAADNGYTRDGNHYHRYDKQSYRGRSSN
jgi:outer membrane lipoprotein SlyB